MTAPFTQISSKDLVWDNPVPAYTWVLSQALGTTGTALGGPGFADRSVQVEVSGTAPTSVTIQGSNDGVNYHTLHDPFNNTLVFTTFGQLAQVTELTLFIQPVYAGGDGTTQVTVTIAACSHLRN